MRILFILHQFFPEFHGGTERVTMNMARMAQHAGHYVRVLASTVEPEKCMGSFNDSGLPGSLESTYQGVPVTLIPRSLLPSTADISLDIDAQVTASLVTWMQEQRFDVAHVLHTMRMGSAVLAVQRCGLPYVLTLTDFFLPCARINLIDVAGNQCSGPNGGTQCALTCAAPPWSTQSYASRHAQSHALLQAAGARVAPSEYVADQYRQAYPEQQFQVIPHGVDFLGIGAATTLSAKHYDAENERPLNLVFVGSVVRAKGLHILLKALARIPSQHLTLKVIGGLFGDPTYHREIQTLVDADSRVAMLGEQTALEVGRALSAADLLCLPSLVPESFSLAFHESAACGTPALVSDLGAPAQFLAHYPCGGVVAAGNLKAWAAAIKKLAEEPQALRDWKRQLFLPLRVEEEAFFYETVYQTLRAQ